MVPRWSVMLTDASLNIWHLATLPVARLRYLRVLAVQERALLPRHKLQAGGPWNEAQVVQRMKLVMFANDCEARLAGRRLGGSRARCDWSTSPMGRAEYLA